MAFFDSFGVSVPSLLFYLVMFGLVFFVLRRFAFGPILRAIDDRQAKINDDLDRAAEAAKSVDDNRARAEEELRAASIQAQEILRRAEKAAQDVHEQARTDAKLQAESLITRAKVEIDRERQAAVAELRAQVVDLALLAAARVIDANLDAEKNKRLIEDTIQHAELHS
jgi:F-type H+-transporting ATPase subunit b